MTKRKLSVYPSPDVEALIQGRDGMDTLSGRLGAVAARYRAIINAHKPDLAEAEWDYCRDSLNGVWLMDELSIESVWVNLHDSADDGLGEKWGVDGRALAENVRRMSKASLVALVECVEDWWAKHG